MTWITLRPHDVWFFRDGRPFNAGEDNSATSLFPPTPFTAQGALRQKISESHGVSFQAYRSGKGKLVEDVEDFIGSYKAQKPKLDTGKFEMRGVFIGVHIDEKTVIPLFPCPADLLKHEDTDEFIITAPKLNIIRSDLDRQLPAVFNDCENLPTHWITGEIFNHYLDGNAPSANDYKPISQRGDKPCAGDIQKDEDKRPPSPNNVLEALQQEQYVVPQTFVFRKENRFGVSTNSATSYRVESMLYQAEFVRVTQDVTLFAAVSGTHPEEYLDGIITLGSDQHQASINQISPPSHFPETPSHIPEGTLFKIIFLTPAYFTDGWKPQDKNWLNLFGENTKVELISAALYRPQRIGSWSSAKGGQEAMHNYVSTGSVYYFKALTDIQSPPNAITESPPHVKDTRKIGFGQVAYSTWSYQNNPIDEE